jgi:Zn-dependent peptidase ImmA (M78 family)
MKKSIITVPDDLLVQLRAPLPKLRMTYGQARLVAQTQAAKLRKLLGARTTRLSLDWIERIAGVSVTMLTADQMEQLTKRPNASGATDVKKDGTYQIYINDGNSITHCRFTLVHELYHVITGPFEADIFNDLGHGDQELHRARIERVADHFAANVLMPKTLVKRMWAVPIQQVSALAAEFGVSEDAMRIRLKTIGLTRSGMTKKMFYRVPRSRAISVAPRKKGGVYASQ